MPRYVEKYLQCLERLREDPLSVDAYFTLAAIYAAEGHRAHALEHLRKAEFLEPGYPGLQQLKERVLALASTDPSPEGPEPRRRQGLRG